MDNISIEVDEPGEQGLFHEDELWITVTGPDPLPDFETIRSLAMKRFNRRDIPTKPMRYYPSWGGPDEPYSEMWLVRKIA